MKVKTEVDEDLKKGVMYEVPCGDCSQVYIGETGRNLKGRRREHQYAVKKDMKNGIAAHACQQHSVDWDGAKMRCTEQHLWKRNVLEAIHIQQEHSTSNLDCGLQLNPVWLPLIKQSQCDLTSASLSSSHFILFHMLYFIVFILSPLFFPCSLYLHAIHAPSHA